MIGRSSERRSGISVLAARHDDDDDDDDIYMCVCVCVRARMCVCDMEKYKRSLQSNIDFIKMFKSKVVVLAQAMIVTEITNFFSFICIEDFSLKEYT